MKSFYPFFLILLFFPSISLFSQDKIDLLILNKDYTEALEQINVQLDQQPGSSLYF